MTLNSADRTKLRRMAHDLDATVHVGKAGTTDATHSELERHLKKDKLVKLRILEAAGDTRATAEALAAAAGAELVEVRGRTAVLWRDRRR